MKEHWKTLGGGLGLNYSENFDAILDSPILVQLAGKEMGTRDIEKVKDMLNQPFFRTIFEMRFPCLLNGKIGRFYAFLYPILHTAKNSNVQYFHTHLHLAFNTPYDFDMRIKKSTFFSRLFSGGSIKSFDPEFNRLIKVTAKKNKVQVKAFIENPKLIESASALFTVCPSSEITDTGIRCEILNGEPDISEVRGLLEGMQKTMECFY
ncbi:MAG: hypothetical protein HPY53_13090 [Brevinematales bacterium]|nr:hypothetical protein [Brevinematales bacterium]